MITPLFTLYELYISEGKTIKTKLLTQKQNKKFLTTIMGTQKFKEHNINKQKMKLKKIDAR